METSPRFWDRRAAEYAKKPVPDEKAYERTLERVRAHLTANDRVLELGCGTGTTALKQEPELAFGGEKQGALRPCDLGGCVLY